MCGLAEVPCIIQQVTDAARGLRRSAPSAIGRFSISRSSASILRPREWRQAQLRAAQAALRQVAEMLSEPALALSAM
jgi:hypothetical protein